MTVHSVLEASPPSFLPFSIQPSPASMSSPASPGVERVACLHGTPGPLPTLLVIGKTGTGKSSVCNVVSGLPHDSLAFPVGTGALSCTQATALTTAHFRGDSARPIALIDTTGFDDPQSDTDTRIIEELKTTLMTRCKYVNLFAITVNGQNPRLDGSLVEMVRILEDMFGQTFWKHCLIIFTRMSMDQKARKKRRATNQQRTDAAIAMEYIMVVQEQFPKAQGLQHLYLDACYDQEDMEEVGPAEEALERLYSRLQGADRLFTSEINDNVQTEQARLKQELEEAERKHKEHLEEVERKHQMEMEQNKRALEAQLDKVRQEQLAAENAQLYQEDIWVKSEEKVTDTPCSEEIRAEDIVVYREDEGDTGSGADCAGIGRRGSQTCSSRAGGWRAWELPGAGTYLTAASNLFLPVPPIRAPLGQ